MTSTLRMLVSVKSVLLTHIVMKGLALLLLLAVGTFAMQETAQKRLMSLKGDMEGKGELEDKPEFDGEFDLDELDLDSLDFDGFGKEFDGEDDGPKKGGNKGGKDSFLQKGPGGDFDGEFDFEGEFDFDFDG